MPASIYPDELAKLFLAHAKDKALVERIWPRLQPLMRRAYMDRYPLMSARLLDPARVAKAIEAGFRTKVDAIRFISLSDKQPLAGLEADEMATHVDRALMTNRDHALDALRNHEKGVVFLKEYFHELGQPLMESLLMGHMKAFTAGDMAVHSIVMTAPAFCLFFLLGHLFAGEEKEVEDMMPLIELLPFAIPLGEPFDELGTWIVLVK
jgi:hypothetical protein